MQQHSLNEKLWSSLLKVIDCFDTPITGEEPARKLSWLLLAAACGTQLAMQVVPDAEIEIDIRPGNDGTAGEVDVSFGIDLVDENGVVLTAPAKISFQQPELTEMFNVFVGGLYAPVSFRSMAYNPARTASDTAKIMAAMFDSYYFEWWVVEQLGYEEVVFCGW